MSKRRSSCESELGVFVRPETLLRARLVTETDSSDSGGEVETTPM
jgi:hypothetical protein